MPRLTAPNGATVDVPDEKAERLVDQGFRAPEDEATKPKRRNRKTASDED